MSTRYTIQVFCEQTLYGDDDDDRCGELCQKPATHTNKLGKLSDPEPRCQDHNHYNDSHLMTEAERQFFAARIALAHQYMLIPEPS